MMPVEKALRLQAWVDGELTPAETREVESWVQEDEEARALAEDLRLTGRLLAEHETKRTLPESREFYWSKIGRAIEGEQARVERLQKTTVIPWWRNWLLPAGALAALAAILGVVRLSPEGQNPAVLAVSPEIETPLADVSLFTFRSESERMTVVWVEFESD